jgi:hypothetical protein
VYATVTVANRESSSGSLRTCCASRSTAWRLRLGPAGSDFFPPPPRRRLFAGVLLHGLMQRPLDVARRKRPEVVGRLSHPYASLSLSRSLRASRSPSTSARSVATWQPCTRRLSVLPGSAGRGGAPAVR